MQWYAVCSHLLLLLCAVALGAVSAANDGPVTCGSVIKLLNVREKVRLHSHEVKYGSGSGQQSVTGMEDSDDVNSHWELRPKIGEPCPRGKPVECGQTIRLKHSSTGCLVHSHHFSSPLTNNQEVSCFGKDGEGDTGDHWQVICNTDIWERGEPVQLKHVDTSMFLGTTGAKYGRPIAGQREVAGLSSNSNNAVWATAEGVYYMPSDSN